MCLTSPKILEYLTRSSLIVSFFRSFLSRNWFWIRSGSIPASSKELMSSTLYERWFSFLNCYFIWSISTESLLVSFLSEDVLVGRVFMMMVSLKWLASSPTIMLGVLISFDSYVFFLDPDTSTFTSSKFKELLFSKIIS